MKLTYLASPYSHPDDAVRQDRFELACVAAAKLMMAGEVVFSPIAHSHSIETLGMPKLGGDIPKYDFWMAQDLPILSLASKLVVLKLDGWKTSRGVWREITHAIENGIPVEYMEP